MFTLLKLLKLRDFSLPWLMCEEGLGSMSVSFANHAASSDTMICSSFSTKGTFNSLSFEAEFL